MRWTVKARLHRALTVAPRGDQLTYLVQRFVTRGLPPPDREFLASVHRAIGHLDRYGRYGPKPVADSRFFEFGAGWHLIGPLTFWACGVESQVIIDRRPLIRAALINDTIDRLPRLAADATLLRDPDRRIEPSEDVVAALRHYGIDYRAPCDAARTGLPSHSLDCITSTSTLEHIPEPALLPILRECHRLLDPRGIASFRIDYADHYSFSDPSVSPYNFLQFSEREWRRWNPTNHFQNRLRHADHRHRCIEAGFDVVEESRGSPDDRQLAQLRATAVDEAFRTRPFEDLATLSATMVLRPAESQSGREASLTMPPPPGGRPEE